MAFKSFITTINSTLVGINKHTTHKKIKDNPSDITEDKTNAFLRETPKEDKILDILRKIDKNLDINGVSGSSHSSTDKREDKEGGSLSTFSKIAGGLGIAAVGKKILSKTGSKVAGKTALKVAGKFGKKIIPLAGVAFSLWDLAKHIKGGYDDYKKYDAEGNEEAKKSVLGYTFIGITSDLLGIVGSLASATGIGIPAALAINAVSVGLDLFSEHLKEKTEASALSTNENIQNSTGLVLRKNNESWEYKTGDRWQPIIDNSTGKPISVESGNIGRTEKSYTLNTINGPVDLVYDGGPKMRNKNGDIIPVNTGYPNPEQKTVKVDIKKNVIVGGGVKLEKTNKIVGKLTKDTAKTMTIKEKPKTFFDRILDGLKTFGQTVETGASETYNSTKQAVGKFTGKIEGNVKSAINSITDATIREQAIRTAGAESGFNTNADAGLQSNGKLGAGGLYQFIPSTWNTYAKKYGYTLNDRFDPYKATRVYTEYQNDVNNQMRKAIGRDASTTDFYMANFLGVAGAAKFIRAYRNNPNAPSTAFVKPNAVANNRTIFFKNKGLGDERTLGEVYAIMDTKMKTGSKYLGSFDIGSNNIQKSGLALIHKGEMIIPAKNASKIRSAMSSMQTIPNDDSDEELSEDFWINTFMTTLASVVKSEYLGAN